MIGNRRFQRAVRVAKPARWLAATGVLAAAVWASPSRADAVDNPARPGNADRLRDEPMPGRPEDPPRPAAGDDRFRRSIYPPYYGGYGSYGGYGGFPSGEVNSFVAAQVRFATAEAMFRRAETELSIAFRNVQHQFETSPELRAAQKEEQDHYDQLNAARRKAIQALANDPTYQRLLALKLDIAAQLETRRAARDITPNEVLAMATLKMGYAMELRSMEVVAINGEPAVRESQDKLVAAGARIAELRAKYDESMRSNADIMIARRNLEDARIAKLTAAAYLRGATFAGAEALDFAYYLNRRSPYYNSYGDPYWGYRY